MSQFPVTFRAAVLEEHKKPLRVQEVTFNGPLDPYQVMVKVAYSGICGKQVEEYMGSHPDPFLPHMLGHEGAGVVTAVGSSVKKVLPGDHVVLHWMKGPGGDAPTPLYSDGKKRINAGWITTFNEVAVVPENRVTPIEKDYDLRLACLMGCAVTTGFGAALNEANLRPGQSVAVVGCGGVGLNILQGADLLKCSTIIGIDLKPEFADRAKMFGATDFVQAGDGAIEEVRKLTGGNGAQTVFVTATSTKAIELATEIAAYPGTVFVVGVPAPGAKVSLDALALHRRRTITGSMGGGIKAESDIPAYLELHRKGYLKLEELITAEYSLDDINQGLEDVMSGRSAGRVVVRM